MFINIFRTLLIFTVLTQAVNGFSQKKEYKLACVGFYNVENLFDTLDTEEVNDSEFSPNGSKRWNRTKYLKKLDNLAKVISEIGTDVSKSGVVALGISEVENITVLQDLVKHDLLMSRNYGIVHYDSPDKRGIDVALLYQKDRFEVENSRSVFLDYTKKSGKPLITRDQLVVTGKLDGDRMHLIVNHWPSRSGGQQKSAPYRNAAGKLSRQIVDSILQVDANAKIVVMGDLNDNPADKSVRKHLGTTRKKEKTSASKLYNPYENIFRKGIGTLAYRDAWSLFDQMIVSKGFVDKDMSKYNYYKAKIFRKKYMLQKEGRYKGYPLRAFVGDTFKGGYADHLPVYLMLVKEK